MELLQISISTSHCKSLTPPASCTNWSTVTSTTATRGRVLRPRFSFSDPFFKFFDLVTLLGLSLYRPPLVWVWWRCRWAWDESESYELNEDKWSWASSSQMRLKSPRLRKSSTGTSHHLQINKLVHKIDPQSSHRPREAIWTFNNVSFLECYLIRD